MRTPPEPFKYKFPVKPDGATPEIGDFVFDPEDETPEPLEVIAHVPMEPVDKPLEDGSILWKVIVTNWRDEAHLIVQKHGCYFWKIIQE